MIVADDAVINRVGRVKLEISFKVRFAERCEGRHVGELSSSRMPCNFSSFSVPSASLWLEFRKKHHRGAQGAEKRGRSNTRQLLPASFLAWSNTAKERGADGIKK